MPNGNDTPGTTNCDGAAQPLLEDQVSSEESLFQLIDALSESNKTDQIEKLITQVADLEESLRLKRGGKVSPFHQVVISCLYDLLEEIKALSLDGSDTKVQEKFNSLKQEFKDLLANPHALFKKKTQQSDSMSAALKSARESYKSHSKGWCAAFSEITQNYQSKLNGVDGFEISNTHRWFYDTYYDGKYRRHFFYKGERYRAYGSLIELWDHLVLVDDALLQSEEMQAAIEHVNEHPQDGVAAFGPLLDALYKAFETVRDDRYDVLNTYLDKLLNKLSETYVIKEKLPDKKELFQAFCREFLLFRALPTNKEQPKDEYDQLKDHIAQLRGKYSGLFDSIQNPGKLIYDLTALRSQLLDEEKKLHQQMKKLKVLTHRFAQELGFESRIVHIQKCCLPEAQDEEKEKTAFASPYQLVDQTTPSFLMSAEKQNRRTVKAQNKKAAKVSASGMAVGEGVVSGVGLFFFLIVSFSLSPVVALILALFAGLSGSFCNYFLVRDVTYLILNEFRFGMFKDTPRWKIGIISFFALVSLATGFVYGALSASSTYIQLLKPVLLGAGLSPHLAIILGLTLSACPVLLTALCMGSILFYTISDFIKNDRISDIKAYFKTYDLPWGEMSRGEVIANLGICAFNAMKLLVGLTLSAVITVVTFGIFHNCSIAVLSAVAKPVQASTASYALAGTNVMATTAFGTEGVFDFLRPISAKGFLKVILKTLPFLVDLPLSILALSIMTLPKYIWSKCFGSHKASTPISFFSQCGLGVYGSINQWVDGHVRGEVFCDLQSIEQQKPIKKHNRFQKKNKGLMRGVTRAAVSSSFSNATGQDGLMLSGSGLLVNIINNLPGMTYQAAFWVGKGLTGFSEAIFSYKPNQRNMEASLGSTLQAVPTKAELVEKAATNEEVVGLLNDPDASNHTDISVSGHSVFPEGARNDPASVSSVERMEGQDQNSEPSSKAESGSVSRHLLTQGLFKQQEATKGVEKGNGPSRPSTLTAL